MHALAIVGLTLAGVALIAGAFLPERRYPKRPEWARILHVSSSDARWALRYRTSFMGAGLCCLLCAVLLLVGH